jgi:hypothetical protein
LQQKIKASIFADILSEYLNYLNMLRLKAALMVFFFLIFFAENGISQGTNSPYSRVGLGDLQRPNSINSFASGGTGIALGSMTHINLLNPALLPLNRYTSFEVSVFMERKNLSDNENSQKDVGGNIGYMALQLPVSRTSSLLLGFQPYSSVKYETTFFRRIEGAPSYARYVYSGSGGLTQAFLGYGAKVAGEFYLGGRINYNFGASTHQSQSIIFDSNDPTGEYIAVLNERINFSDASFQGGAFYRVLLNEKKTKSLNFGITYDAAANISGYQRLVFARTKVSGGTASEDTLKNDEKTLVSLPSGVGFGISLQKALHYGIGIDVFMQDWSKYKQDGAQNNLLGKSLRVSLGGEFTPNPTSVDSYFNRITYRAGFSYYESPVIVAGKNLQEYSLRAGLSMPFGRYFSSFNLAFSAGQRQSSSANPLKENFLQVHLGGTINDRWFIRRKYD